MRTYPAAALEKNAVLPKKAYTQDRELLSLKMFNDKFWLNSTEIGSSNNYHFR